MRSFFLGCVIAGLGSSLVLATLACGGGGGTSGGPGAGPVVFSGPYHYVAFTGDAGAPTRATGQWGLLTSDGAGGVTGDVTRNINGAVAGPAGIVPLLSAVGAGGAMTWELSTSPGVTHIRGGLGSGGRAAVMGKVRAGDPASLYLLLARSGVFGNASLTGEYHWGALSFSPPGATVALWGGTVDFNGAGAASTTLAVNADGIITPLAGPLATPYAVAADGSLTYTFGTSVMTGGILLGGDILVLSGSMDAGEDPVLAVMIRKAAAATNASLSGSYFVAGVQGDTGGYRGSTGVIVADGVGGLTTQLTENDEGVISTPAPDAATYAVAADGAFTLTAGDTFRGAVSADGRFAFLTGGTNGGSEPMMFFFVR